jgi:RNA polymerase sigma-32 factor
MDDHLDTFLAGVDRIKPLSRDKELELARVYRDSRNPQAAHLLLTSHLPLVVGIARAHHKNGLRMVDLIHEGNVGLLQAIEKFDPELGTRFATFATDWIRARISAHCG